MRKTLVYTRAIFADLDLAEKGCRITKAKGRAGGRPSFIFDQVDQVKGELTLTCATAGASIHYTLDGATADASIYYTLDGTTPVSSLALYTDPISIGSTKMLKAVAIKAGYTNRSILTQAYTIASSGGTTTKRSSDGCDAGAMGLMALLMGCALRLRSGHDGCIRRK